MSVDAATGRGNGPGSMTATCHPRSESSHAAVRPNTPPPTMTIDRLVREFLSRADCNAAPVLRYAAVLHACSSLRLFGARRARFLLDRSGDSHASIQASGVAGAADERRGRSRRVEFHSGGVGRGHAT